MKEPIPIGFRIAGTLILLFFAVWILLAIAIVGGGAEFIVGFIYDWGAIVAGAPIGAVAILSIVRWLNRRRDAP